MFEQTMFYNENKLFESRLTWNNLINKLARKKAKKLWKLVLQMSVDKSL